MAPRDARRAACKPRSRGGAARTHMQGSLQDKVDGVGQLPAAATLVQSLEVAELVPDAADLDTPVRGATGRAAWPPRRSGATRGGGGGGGAPLEQGPLTTVYPASSSALRRSGLYTDAGLHRGARTVAWLVKGRRAPLRRATSTLVAKLTCRRPLRAGAAPRSRARSACPPWRPAAPGPTPAQGTGPRSLPKAVQGAHCVIWPTRSGPLAHVNTAQHAPAVRRLWAVHARADSRRPVMKATE